MNEMNKLTDKQVIASFDTKTKASFDKLCDEWVALEDALQIAQSESDDIRQLIQNVLINARDWGIGVKAPSSSNEVVK